MDSNVENRFYDLLGLKMTNGATPEELIELNRLMEDNQEFLFLYSEVEDSIPLQPYKSEILEQAFASHYVKQRLLPDIENREKKLIPLKKTRFQGNKMYFPVAASIVLLAIVYYFFFISNLTRNSNTATQNVVSSEKGSKSKVVLPDGTNVILNSDSRISYSNSFNKNTREVTLSGEGFFDVKYDEKRPFIIHTGIVRIKVLGTSFNVRNYPQDDLIETSLIKGSIELTTENQKGSKFIMKPSEKMIIFKNNIVQKNPSTNSGQRDIFKLTHITSDKEKIDEISWMENKVSFSNKSLGEIAKELERLFNLTVIFKNKETIDYRYTIHSRNYNLNEIIDVLKLSRDFNYSINNDTLTIK